MLTDPHYLTEEVSLSTFASLPYWSLRLNNSSRVINPIAKFGETTGINPSVKFGEISGEPCNQFCSNEMPINGKNYCDRHKSLAPNMDWSDAKSLDGKRADIFIIPGADFTLHCNDNTNVIVSRAFLCSGSTVFRHMPDIGDDIDLTYSSDVVSEIMKFIHTPSFLPQYSLKMTFLIETFPYERQIAQFVHQFGIISLQDYIEQRFIETNPWWIDWVTLSLNLKFDKIIEWAKIHFSHNPRIYKSWLMTTDEQSFTPDITRFHTDCAIAFVNK